MLANLLATLPQANLVTAVAYAAEIRRRHQQGEQVRSRKDAAVQTPSQTLVEASVPALNAMDDAEQVIEDSKPLQAIVEGEEESHSPSPQDDERNREYLIRRAALGDNPTKEDMRAVVAYGLQQHRMNFPHLY